MKFCVVKNKDGEFLCKQFEHGYSWGTLTGSDDQFELCWRSPDQVFEDTTSWYGDPDKASLIIFEDMGKANKFIEERVEMKGCIAILVDEVNV